MLEENQESGYGKIEFKKLETAMNNFKRSFINYQHP